MNLAMVPQLVYYNKWHFFSVHLEYKNIIMFYVLKYQVEFNGSLKWSAFCYSVLHTVVQLVVCCVVLT